jgi:hypothetical protein
VSRVIKNYSTFVIYILSRFVDRDMVMRFLGAGIGHKATNKYTTALRTDSLTMAKATVAQPDTNFEGPQIPDSEDALLAEEQDYGYELSSESEGDEGVDDEDDGGDLGAEDGEEPWEADDLHALGYDEL